MGNPKNLERWHAANPGRQQRTTHGAFSRAVKRKYSDNRTTEAKKLNAIMAEIVADLGGTANISAAQSLLLDNIRAKLIVIIQISEYAARQDCLIDAEGNLMGCLGRNYLGYSEALRRDLQALAGIGKAKGPATYERAMAALEGTKK